jgi:hypothetical protein
MRKLVTGLACVAAVTALACKDALTTPNLHDPDIARAYSTPSTLAGLIGTNFAQIHNGLMNTSSSLDPQLMVASFESYGTVANFSMALREALPRTQIDNSRGNTSSAENFRDFQQMSKQARYAGNYVQALDVLNSTGGHLSFPSGDAAADEANLKGEDLRARSFAFFNNGVALGWLAMEYDSAAITTPATRSDSIPPLSPYSDVMAAALASMDTAIAIGSSAAAAPGFPLPDEYFNGSNLTQSEYIALIRSFKARFRAGVARTPAERDAVDWNAVLADATNGIQNDFVITINSSEGWGLSWLDAQMFQNNSAGWHQMSLMIFGMADTSGAYDSWIKLPLSARPYILVKTGDKRWPSGETRAAQQANSPANDSWDYTKYPYIRNRSNSDTPGEPWGSSFYDFYRFKDLNFQSPHVGPWISMAKAEIDMLAAEAYIRKSDYVSAAALINKTRTKAGLPAVTGTQSGGLSGATCVPRVPTSAGNATQCGDLMEAMKYEKRMETAYTGYGQWYFDGRGWGDLAEGTPLEWPVPFQEMDARGHPFYNLGGVGGPMGAAKGTYGF